jgi:hypothetical protein
MLIYNKICHFQDYHGLDQFMISNLPELLITTWRGREDLKQMEETPKIS